MSTLIFVLSDKRVEMHHPFMHMLLQLTFFDASIEFMSSPLVSLRSLSNMEMRVMTVKSKQQKESFMQPQGEDDIDALRQFVPECVCFF